MVGSGEPGGINHNGCLMLLIALFVIWDFTGRPVAS